MFNSKESLEVENFNSNIRELVEDSLKGLENIYKLSSKKKDLESNFQNQLEDIEELCVSYDEDNTEEYTLQDVINKLSSNPDFSKYIKEDLTQLRDALFNIKENLNESIKAFNELINISNSNLSTKIDEIKK